MSLLPVDEVHCSVATEAVLHSVSSLTKSFAGSGKPMALIYLSSSTHDMSNIRFFLEHGNQCDDSGGHDLFVLRDGGYSAPYSFSSVDEKLIAYNVNNLAGVFNAKRSLVCVMDLGLLFRRLPPVLQVCEGLHIGVGKGAAYDSVIEKLVDFGYNRVSNVYEFGEFAVRGYIIDIGFLEGFVRFEFDGDLVRRAFFFTPDTQRNKASTDRVFEIFRVKEASLAPEACITFCDRAVPYGLLVDSLEYRSVKSGMPFLGMEGYAPLFYAEGELSNALDYLPSTHDIVVVIEDGFGARLKELHSSIIEGCSLSGLSRSFVPEPSALFYMPDKICDLISGLGGKVIRITHYDSAP